MRTIPQPRLACPVCHGTAPQQPHGATDIACRGPRNTHKPTPMFTQAQEAPVSDFAVPFPCTVERMPLDRGFQFPHNVVCTSDDDLHAGDTIIAIGDVPLVRPITILTVGSDTRELVSA